MKPEARTTAAHHFLDGLAEAGPHDLFCNLGTDPASPMPSCT